LNQHFFCQLAHIHRSKFLETESNLPHPRRQNKRSILGCRNFWYIEKASGKKEQHQKTLTKKKTWKCWHKKISGVLRTNKEFTGTTPNVGRPESLSSFEPLRFSINE
jgi:hypothetical protein